MLDNQYTHVIISCMLPQQLTLPVHPPAKLTPSLSCSCSLLCAPKKVNSHQISSFQPLFAKHPGGGWSAFPPFGINNFQPLFPAPVAIVATGFSKFAFPLASVPCACPDPVGVPLSQPILFVLCFHNDTNCSSRNLFLFTTIRIAPGVYPQSHPQGKEKMTRQIANSSFFNNSATYGDLRT